MINRSSPSGSVSPTSPPKIESVISKIPPSSKLATQISPFVPTTDIVSLFESVKTWSMEIGLPLTSICDSIKSLIDWPSLGLSPLYCLLVGIGQSFWGIILICTVCTI